MPVGLANCFDGGDGGKDPVKEPGYVLVNGSCFDNLEKLPNDSIRLLIIDPPAGMLRHRNPDSEFSTWTDKKWTDGEWKGLMEVAWR